jgi:hypothetical protein
VRKKVRDWVGLNAIADVVKVLWEWRCVVLYKEIGEWRCCRLKSGDVVVWWSGDCSCW